MGFVVENMALGRAFLREKIDVSLQIVFLPSAVTSLSASAVKYVYYRPQ